MSKTSLSRVKPAKRIKRSATGNGKPAKPPAAAPVNFPIVGVGASAGGMEAFQKLLRHLPDDIPCAIVFVSHLDPTHESELDAIFQRETKLTVKTVRQPTAVESGNIYVLAPDRALRLVNGVLRPEPRARTDGQFRPVDTFFESLAADQGNCAVGVLLSGNGTDGTIGLQQIKSEGGITFVQNVESATFRGMPGNPISTGCVDFVLPPEEIANELKRIAKHPAIRRARGNGEEPILEGESELHRVFGLLRALNGVDFSLYKPSTIKRRILRRMVLRKMDNLRDYSAHLHHNPTEVDALFHDLLINVTSFFRDPDVFQALRKKVYPKLVNRERREPIRIWIPGCATGEEVYSIAISVFEFLGKKPDARMVQIFGTDISENALVKARAGVYPETLAAQISPERLRRFFHKVDGGYQITKYVRDSCVFARQNLIEDPPFSKLDLVSCRNVLIYLGASLQKRVIPIFHYALKTGGHLLLGGSETIGGFSELFDLVDKKHKIYARREVNSRPDLGHPPKPVFQEPEPFTNRRPPEREETPRGPQEITRMVDRLLLAQYAPSGVVVNSKLEVVQFRGQTSAYIEHPPGEASLNVLKMIRSDLMVDVRTVLNRAIKMDGSIRKEQLEFVADGKTRHVNLEVTPFKTTADGERYFLLLFTEALPPLPVAKAGGRRASNGRETAREVLRLREELSASKESLQAIIEEQEATNEELKSANEEIQSSNEELQSTNEELETAKEELQSTNEELTTLNEELQNRNQELSQLNNDLGNLLSSVSMPILMLGNDLTIRRFTPLAERFFNLIPTDIGRRVTDINPNIDVSNLEQVVSEVIDTLRTQEHEVQDREGRWYSLRVRPYRTTENKIDGAVVLLVDVDEIRRGLNEFMALIDQPLVMLRGDMRINQANDAFHAFFHTTAREVENALIYDVQGGRWNIPALKTLLETVLSEKPRVNGYEIEHEFGPVGRKKLSINARRLYQRSKGTQLTFLSFSEIA